MKPLILGVILVILILGLCTLGTDMAPIFILLAIGVGYTLWKSLPMAEIGKSVGKAIGYTVVIALSICCFIAIQYAGCAGASAIFSTW